MKKLATMLLGLSLVLGSTAFAAPAQQDQPKAEKGKKKKAGKKSSKKKTDEKK